MQLTYCTVHLNRLNELQRNVRHYASHVDKMIVSDGGSTDGSIQWLQSEECRQYNLEVVIKKQTRLPYGNHTPDARNPYLKIAGTTGWILVVDTDEYLEEEACEHLRYFATRAEQAGYDEVRFQAHDVWTYETGEVYDNLSNYWKQDMFVKAYPGMEYRGHTHSGLLRPGAVNSFAKAQSQGGKFLLYRHEKTERMMWRNSTFLYWTTSGVAQNRTDSADWHQFHDIMNSYNFEDWHDFIKVMEKGNIPEVLKDWFVAHKDDENPEAAAYFIYYFVFLHPHENITRISSDKYNRYTWDYTLNCRRT
jgi:glycosyltransferase involved in cell wall biosynthesis